MTFYCKACNAAYDEARRQRDPEKYAATRRRATYKHLLRTKFGMTVEQYEAMVAAQQGVCAICQRPEFVRSKHGVRQHLLVDHCHVTGQVRALLCNACNNGLGRFQDDPTLLRAAANYLEHHSVFT